MRQLSFDASGCVIPAAGGPTVHHYRTVRRVHPQGDRVKVVLDTTPGSPGEIMYLPWDEFRASCVKQAVVV
jgi:hypothetical protein